MRDIDWKIIYELYQIKNITKVADKLFMTQPTLTKRLQSIEEEFGTRLVNRSTKGVQFTKEGEFLAHQSELYLQFRGGISRRMEAFKDEGVGTIRVASSYSFSKFYLPGMIREYQKEFPNISFDVHNTKSHNLIQFLTNGVSDMAFVRGEYDCDLHKRKLLTEGAYIISSVPLTMESLTEEKRIDCILGESSRKIIDRWWEENFLQPPRVSTTVRMVDTSWEMVRQGVGYTVGFFEQWMLESMDIFYMPIFYKDGSPVERNTWLIYSDKVAKSPEVQKFIYLAEEKF